MAYVPCADTGSSIIPLGVAWGSEPGGIFWGPVSIDYSCNSSLGRGMIENSFIWHYFERVKFSREASSECSSTRFSYFLGLFPSLYSPNWIMCHQIPHGTGGGYTQFWCLIIVPRNLCVMVSFQDKILSFPLVPIWVSLPDLPTVVILGQRRGNPRCGSLLEIFGTLRLQNSSAASFRPHPYLGCCTCGTQPWSINSTEWYYQPLSTVWWCGGGVLD